MENFENLIKNRISLTEELLELINNRKILKKTKSILRKDFLKSDKQSNFLKHRMHDLQNHISENTGDIGFTLEKFILNSLKIDQYRKNYDKKENEKQEG